MASIDKSQLLRNASVTADVFTLRPDYRAVLLLVDGINPGPSDEATESLLQDAEATARKLMATTPVNSLPHIAAWQEAYKAFGAKPKKYRNSLEALTRRITPDAGLPRVNRLTDIYNAISVKHQIPLGGEDVAKYDGPPRLIRASGKEEFQINSGGEIVMEHPDAGEVVWVDDTSVTCRRWNWRQGRRTALTDETTTALFICDALGAMSDASLEAAIDDLVVNLQKLGPQVTVEKRTITQSSAA